MSLKGNHLTNVFDLNREQIELIFETAKDLKRRQKIGQPHQLLKGKSLGMIFQKPSTRTRVSFEVGMTQLGGHALYLGPNDLQLNRGETIADTAKVLSRYVDGIMARVFSHNDIVSLAENSTVPVINGLSDRFHPCQALTDLFTILEKYQSFDGLKVGFVGDGDNNVTYSLMYLCARLGIDISVGCPPKYNVKDEVLAVAKKEANKTGAKITVTPDPEKAVALANVIYTDVWVSMGREDKEERLKALKPYQVNNFLIKRAARHAIIMHCLPAHRGEELTNEVMDGPQSVVFDQAENRLHIQKAIMALMM
ncbi:MAG: ornithine carbamoyltransferase [Candidatus Pacebacteria bacterium]|nr:ornithine carbamoyltransferase [Candidatus Paceibacterota bacterium]